MMQSLQGIFSASAQISFEALRGLQLDVTDKASYSHPSTERLTIHLQTMHVSSAFLLPRVWSLHTRR
jgi:hypothetical protein